MDESRGNGWIDGWMRFLPFGVMISYYDPGTFYLSPASARKDP